MNQDLSDRYKVLCIASHPVQYSAPLFRKMAQNPQLDILVAYCSLQGVKKGFDRGFGIDVQWDIPLLDNYPWVELSNQSLNPGLGKFWGLLNLGLWKTIFTGNYDAIVILTGYTYASFWLALIASKIKKIPVLFGTDAHEINSKDKKILKANLKKILLPFIFNLADQVTVVSSGGLQAVKSLGISEKKIQLTPYAVNNEWWLSQVKQIDRNLIRQNWNIPEKALVILFCAKLQPWKSPQDLLLAFAEANLSQAYLVFAGHNVLLKRWVKQPKSPYCFVSAHDTLLQKDCLKMLIDCMDKNPDIGIVCPEYGKAELPKYSPIKGPYIVPTTPRKIGTIETVDFAHATLLLCRRECLQDVNFFDERHFAYGDEYDISLKAWKHNWKVAIVWGAIIINPGSWTPKPLLSYLLARNTLLLALTHGGWISALIRSILMVINTLRIGLVPNASKANFFPLAKLYGLRDFWLRRYGSPSI
jgi:hypothetical protein